MGKSADLMETGVLTLSEIKGKNLIRTPDGSEVNSYSYSNASFDFTLGNEYFFPKQFHDELKKAAELQGVKSDELTTTVRQDILKKHIGKCSENDWVLKIPPFSSVVISTFEKVTLPSNVAGRFDLRVKWAMAGLVLQVGTQIEPGYHGTLWGLLHNFSGEEVIIACNHNNHRLLTAEFYYTTAPAEPSEEKKRKPSTLLDFLNKYPVKSGSLQNYFDEIKRISDDLEKRVLKSLDEMQKHRIATVEDIDKKISNETLAVQALRTNVDQSQQQVRDLLTNSQAARENRNLLLYSIITIVVSVISPLLITKMTFEKGDYELFDKTKEMKEQVDAASNRLKSMETKIDQLTVESAKKDSIIGVFIKKAKDEVK